mmetsp:Transcript_11185/g.18802  ORF Transcript_11185/g.18802 Transcript_11185/m.18802 type:complete len:91 (-) Transcript_11185:41-313(-)
MSEARTQGVDAPITNFHPVVIGDLTQKHLNNNQGLDSTCIQDGSCRVGNDWKSGMASMKNSMSRDSWSHLRLQNLEYAEPVIVPVSLILL